MNLQRLIEELERQKPLKWDRRANSATMQMLSHESGLTFKINGDGNIFSITKPCHQQIAERLEIPAKYYHKMESEAPELLVNNVNTWLGNMGKDFFVRGMGENMRALLSDRYRVIDHLDVLYCALNELQAHEAEIEDCYLSETEVNIKAKSRKLKDFIRNRDDLIIGGLLFTNSETGHKALRLEPRLFRVKCTNGMVIENMVTRQIHLGNGEDESDEMIYLSIRRSIKELFSRFGEIIENLRESTEIKISNPQKVINNVVIQYGLSEGQKENILMAFGAEPELDQYGIANAITRAAQIEESWERSLELERMGGRLVSLSPKEFKCLEA
ncbi:MAG: DUF932 domain-containing protein [Candidatus Schekmanbacteria bacterium]|nr:DUF932 domain-containing protein [Candidatus Schekmanbacteria bacterium]